MFFWVNCVVWEEGALAFCEDCSGLMVNWDMMFLKWGYVVSIYCFDIFAVNELVCV